MWIAKHLPQSLKFTLRACRYHVRGALVRSLYGFRPDDLAEALRRLGIAPGDTVMAHTSFAHFEGFQGSASDAIQTLQSSVGDSGTFLMPTIPFGGTAFEYVASGRITDIRRTPSAMGLLTELFRRRIGVVRSIHPTHPIAAAGRRAAELTASHYTAATPCGKGSPFHRLLEADGQVLLAGAGIEAMTFFHYIEEHLEPKMPFSPFTSEWFDLQTRGPDGQMYQTHTRLYDPAVSSRRRLEPLRIELKAAGAWRETTVGRLRLAAVRASSALDAAEAMANAGKYCYSPPA